MHACRRARQSARRRARPRHLRSHWPEAQTNGVLILRQGVPCVFVPGQNPLYCDVLKHYSVVALPCRVAHPDRKGKVESGVGHAQKTLLKGLRFESLEEAQNYLDHWEERWADTRIHGTTKRQVAVMFAEERPALQPLPWPEAKNNGVLIL